MKKGRREKKKPHKQHKQNVAIIYILTYFFSSFRENWRVSFYISNREKEQTCHSLSKKNNGCNDNVKHK